MYTIFFSFFDDKQRMTNPRENSRIFLVRDHCRVKVEYICLIFLKDLILQVQSWSSHCHMYLNMAINEALSNQ